MEPDHTGTLNSFPARCGECDKENVPAQVNPDENQIKAEYVCKGCQESWSMFWVGPFPVSQIADFRAWQAAKNTDR